MTTSRPLQARDVYCVRLGSSPGHPAVVLGVTGDGRAVVICGTSSGHVPGDRFTVHLASAEGRRLKLTSAETYFYRSTICRMRVDGLQRWQGVCTTELFNSLRSFAEADTGVNLLDARRPAARPPAVGKKAGEQ